MRAFDCGVGAMACVLTLACVRCSTKECTASDTCSVSVDAYCASAQCIRDWATASDPHAWCGHHYSVEVFERPVAGFRTVFVNATDTSLVYFFDATSGQLAAIAHTGIEGQRCVAGPSGFAPPVTCVDGQPACCVRYPAAGVLGYCSTSGDGGSE